MRFKTGFLIGLGTGYVLGAKAGRERYQQIVDATRAFMENPGVQRLTDEVNKTVSIGRERVTDAATRRVEQVSGTLAEQASKARSFVSGGESSEDTGAEAKKESGTEAAKKAGPKKAAEETSGTPPSTTTTGTTTRSGRTS
jgi:hypothetical protein